MYCTISKKPLKEIPWIRSKNVVQPVYFKCIRCNRLSIPSAFEKQLHLFLKAIFQMLSIHWFNICRNPAQHTLRMIFGTLFFCNFCILFMAILIEIAALIFIHERVLYRERSFESPNLLHAVNAPAIVNETSDGISLRRLLKVIPKIAIMRKYIKHGK